MLNKIHIKNFRSIEDAEFQLAPVNVLYGPTASGKSSSLYALLVLRNFVLNPNRPPDGFFNLGFMDLGGFDACVFNHDTSRKIEVSVEAKEADVTSSYSISISKSGAKLAQKYGIFKMEAEVTLPYGINQSFPFTLSSDNEEFSANWNGITATVTPRKPTTGTQLRGQEISKDLNRINEIIKAIDISPHRRGFFRPNYSPAQVSLIPTSDEEVGSIIISDQHLAGRISTYAEDIFGRDFRTYTPPGTATAFFQSTDKKSRIPVYLVNEGFGVNQIIYLLAKILRSDVETVLIEEPEIHLHPTVLRTFAKTLCTLAKEENKQLILATHSEQFMITLLAAVHDESLKPEELNCILSTKEKKMTIFKSQKVTQQGELEGGLTAFMETQLEDLKRFLGK